MLILKQSTSIDIRVGPFVDAADGVTPEIGITLGAADQAEVLKANGAATAAMAGTFAAITGADGWYDYTVATGDVDTVGEVVFVVQDLSVCLPVYVRGYVVEEAVYDAMYGAASAGPLQATTAGRTLDILATGEVPIDFDTSIGSLAAAQIEASALDDKGNWNVGKTGYSLTQSFPTNFADMAITVTTGEVDANVTEWLGTAVTISSTTSKPEVDTFSISDDSAAADNLEAMYDGTGYADDTAPSSRAQVDGIGTAGGAAVNTDANTSNEGGGISGVTSGTTIVGTPTNTYTATSILDGTYHIMTHATNAIDIVYQFLTGGGTEPVAVVWAGYLTSANDTLTMSAWNHVGVAWEVIGSIPGTGGTSNSVINPILFPRHRGTSVAEFGKVYIRLHATGQTSPVLNTDQLYVQFSVTSRTTGYDGGQIWIDTTHGTPGTEDYVNGVADFKTDTLADAITLGASVGLESFNVSPESTITFAESHTDEIWKGDGWTLALGGQDVSQSHIYHCNDVSGIGTSPSGEVHVLDSHIGATTLGASHITNCSFASSFTAGAAGDYFIENSRSGVAGSGNPTMTFTGLGSASNINARGWLGGGTWAFDSDCTASIEVFMGGTHTITTGGGDVEFRGTPKNLVIVTSGAGTTNIIIWSGAPIAISGTGGTVNIYGIHNGITDTSSGTTVTDFGSNILNLASILDDTADMQPKLGTPAADLSADIAAVKVETALIVADTNELQGDDVPGLIAALNDISVADILTTQMTEAYAADGAAPTIAQALLMIQQILGEFAISGTTLTMKKVDGISTAATFTLDDGTNPTSLTRAS
jgi:hypothetical protein